VLFDDRQCLTIAYKNKMARLEKLQAVLNIVFVVLGSFSLKNVVKDSSIDPDDSLH